MQDADSNSLIKKSKKIDAYKEYIEKVNNIVVKYSNGK
jgi:hypothetical protein